MSATLVLRTLKPALVEALAALCRERPKEPVVWLATYLRAHKRASLLGDDPGALARLRQTSAAHFFGLEALLDSVASGALAPIRGRWIIALHRRGGRLARRQDLPPEAFWTAAELRRVATALGDQFGLLFVALSYRWLAREHPDADAFHLGKVAAVAEMYLKPAAYYFYSPLVVAFADCGLGEADFALFWDFGSLFQAPRSAAQSVLFGVGLRASNLWYGHATTVCWMQDELPPGFAGATYDRSGWCFVEAAMSAVVKGAKSRLALSKGARILSEPHSHYAGDILMSDDMRLSHVCAASRLPPPTPAKVQHLLETEKVFTNSSDIGVVAMLYQRFFETVSTGAAALDFGSLGWGASEGRLLSEVLPHFASLTEINLKDNKLGEEGWCAIFDALRDNSHMKINTWDLSRQGINLTIAKSLAAYVAVTASLTFCNLLNNEMDVASAQLLVAAVKDKDVSLASIKPDQTERDFSHKNLRPPDAVLLASDLSKPGVSAVLTNLS